MSTNGLTEIALVYGGDFTIQPNGDLELAQNSATSTLATEQRLQRLLLTAPYIPGVNPTADDIFNPSYGVGLPLQVGQMVTNELVSRIQAAVTSGLNSDPTIASIESIDVSPLPGMPVGTQGVTVTIKATANTGQPIVLQIPPAA